MKWTSKVIHVFNFTVFWMFLTVLPSPLSPHYHPHFPPYHPTIHPAFPYIHTHTPVEHLGPAFPVPLWCTVHLCVDIKTLLQFSKFHVLFAKDRPRQAVKGKVWNWDVYYYCFLRGGIVPSVSPNRSCPNYLTLSVLAVSPSCRL